MTDPFLVYSLGMALGAVLVLSGVHLLDSPRHRFGIALIVTGGLCAVAGSIVFLRSLVP